MLTRVGVANSTDLYPPRLFIQTSTSTHAPLGNIPRSNSTGASFKAFALFLVNL